jgi:hypothetical protein
MGDVRKFTFLPKQLESRINIDMEEKTELTAPLCVVIWSDNLHQRRIDQLLEEQLQIACSSQ